MGGIPFNGRVGRDDSLPEESRAAVHRDEARF